MRLATDHGFTIRAVRRAGALLLGALGALALSGCNAGDELTPPGAPMGGTGAVQMVPTLANEFDLVDITINGAIWNQAAPYGVGTGSLNPFLGVQGQNNDYDDNPDTEEGFNSDVSPNDLEGGGQAQSAERRGCPGRGGHRANYRTGPVRGEYPGRHRHAQG